jgi:aminoglycoside phosphotransferase family enzyme/predicted kinase
MSADPKACSGPSHGPNGQDQSYETAELLAFLCDPRSYPHRVETVTRVETHASIVFLAGDRAYKLKRAVKLPYLDYSTVEKRHAAIQREFEINARASPEIYVGTVAVVRLDTGGFALGAEGQAVDWLLVMYRFNEADVLSSLASEGKIDRPLATALATSIEHVHRLSERVNDGQWLGTIDSIVAGIEAALLGGEAQAVGLQLAPYAARLCKEIASHADLAAERGRDGFVRRCHGDLHLRNIVLWKGEPRLFDAIEFDEKLQIIDVLYDLAFLLMDLWTRGLRGQANSVLNRAFESAGPRDFEGLALLPLYLSLRAAIRAMTGLHALRFGQDEHRSQAIVEIGRYAAAAEEFLRPGKPQLVAVGGLSGTGKSTVAREIAPSLGRPPGAIHLRTDVERKLMLGVPWEQPLPADAYTAENRDETYRRIFKKAEVVLAAGHSAIIDAVFPEASARAFARDVAQRTNATFYGMWLEATADALKRRVAERTGDASDADAHVVQQQLCTVLAPGDWVRIDACGTPDATIAVAAQALQNAQK